jgi:murein L,D-transpeptidase YafK
MNMLKSQKAARMRFARLFIAGNLMALALALSANARQTSGLYVAGPAKPDAITDSLTDTGRNEFLDGPVLFYKQGSEPIYLLLVEKAFQKCHLYRYDGRYALVRTYTCVTGQNVGKKQAEKDRKTPEGIFFNNKVFRDTKITLYGDRAFGLTYPDIFDQFEGNGGSGIFIHGTNRAIEPFSTQGCVAMDNLDLKELDKLIRFDQTPVIIGDRLPYRFGPANRDFSELIPFFQQAMTPAQYARLPQHLQSLIVLGLKERVIVVGKVRIEKGWQGKDLMGFSKLYLAGPGKNLLVLIKREWHQEQVAFSIVKKADAVPEQKNIIRPVTIKETISAKQQPPAEVPPAPITAKPIVKKEEAPPENALEASTLTALVESWRTAWQDKRLDDYIAHYHPDFTAKGRNVAQWKAYKKILNQKNKQIRVDLSNIRVTVENEKAQVIFIQNYRSDTFKSRGYKMLVFKKLNNTWKIAAEEMMTKKKPAQVKPQT